MNQAATFERIPTVPVSLDAEKTLEAGRIMSRALAESSAEIDRLILARSFAHHLVVAWWDALNIDTRHTQALRPRLRPFEIVDLPASASALADSLGRAAAQLDPETAAYHIGLTYTGMLPAEYRSGQGIFYTPPSLPARLIAQATAAGVDWTQARVLDPACGGGAFLTPIAQRILDALPGRRPEVLLESIATRLRGYELDPFGAWLSQVSLDALFLPISRESGQRLPVMVTVCDSLHCKPPRDGFDLVIGNPPYGRVTLTAKDRETYKRGLFGHANLYGLFTDMAIRHTKIGGIIAYVTPTSFLAGEYFKNLRALLGREAPPVAIDFVTARKGVFEEVLQETSLTTYRRGGERGSITVHQITPANGTELSVKPVGTIALPLDLSSPWLLPREALQAALVTRLACMPYRLADWGYTVSTGPLVWNRQKDQLTKKPGRNRYPLIWSEALTSDGRFEFRAEKRNHAPYFEIRSRDKSLLINTPCVLLQRTTAKEQARRLIAAALPEEFLAKHSAVVVENHLNMLRPTTDVPAVPVEVLAAFLNSGVADRIFRCVSGSVAVSAFELEALPLPDPSALDELQRIIRKGGAKKEIDVVCDRLYGEVAE